MTDDPDFDAPRRTRRLRPLPEARRAPARFEGDPDVFAAMRDAVDDLLALHVVPVHHELRAGRLLPPDIATRLLQLVAHSAGLPRAEPFPDQEAFDEFMAAAPELDEAELQRGLSRLPRDVLESVTAYFVGAFAARDREARELLAEQTARARSSVPDAAAAADAADAAADAARRRAAEEVRRVAGALARSERLLEMKTARIDELLRRVSELVQEREEARALLRGLEEAAPPPDAPAPPALTTNDAAADGEGEGEP